VKRKITRNQFNESNTNPKKPFNMKKIKGVLIVLALISFSACNKSDDTPEKTTYQIINNMEDQGDEIEYLDGTLWEVTVFCYIGDDIARQDNVDPVEPDGGESDMVEVKKEIEKVKVSFKLLPKASSLYDISANNRKYVASFFYLDKGKNTDIVIDGNTMVGPTLNPSSVNRSSIDRVIEELNVSLNPLPELH
jgi:hypothetical protein